MKHPEEIQSVLLTGKEYVFLWNDDQEALIEYAMNTVGSYLDTFDASLSYEGTDRKVVWRKSCWFASHGIDHPLIDTETGVAKFDGDLKDGLAGLHALQDAKVRDSIDYLKTVLDESLIATSQAIGLGDGMVERCSVRYRAIKYVFHAGKPGGIGLHPDGNLLSALITNGDGLKVYDLDGTERYPSHHGTIIMGGSTLYRWSEGKYPPTFHDVEITGDQQKVSIVAFFNFPDNTTIPRSVGAGFVHDIRACK